MTERWIQRGTRSAWVAPALALAAAALAYQPLLALALKPPDMLQLERWLFRPSQIPPLFVLAVAAWLVWRRSERLAALPEPRSALAALALSALAALALSALAAGIYVWALRTRTTDLLFPSLSAALLAFGALARGLRGIRALLFPALVLLLGVPIPAPLRHEIVWQLQLATAAGSGWLLNAAGLGFDRAGVILHGAEHTFQVIDGCSGLQGIVTLTLIALIVRELSSRAGARAWLPVLIAPLLGLALNLVRVASVAASANPEALAGLGADHTPQGLAVLAVGVGLLYAIGRSVDRPRALESEPAARASALPGIAWWSAAAAAAALAATAALVPPFAEAASAETPRALEFPESAYYWTSERLPTDPHFVGLLPSGHLLQRRFAEPLPDGGSGLVDVFLAMQAPPPFDAGPLFTSKLAWPGPDWSIVAREPVRIWVLGREGELAIAAPADERVTRAVVYTWRVRHRGLWRESARALFALDASPFRREAPSVAVRMVAFSASEQEEDLSLARRRLDYFLRLFREHFDAL